MIDDAIKQVYIALLKEDGVVHSYYEKFGYFPGEYGLTRSYTISNEIENKKTEVTFNSNGTTDFRIVYLPRY